jgi:hypothetical protein
MQVDGGPWRTATIVQRSADSAWLLWSFDLNDATPGPHTLICRATNVRGEIQPTREELRERLIGNREDSAQWPGPVIIEPPA